MELTLRAGIAMMSQLLDSTGKPPRSAFSSITRRQPQPWDAEKPFRILSIDGGGIKGIFPAAFLAQIELHLLNGRSVADNFDLIAGTSTGGILALRSVSTSLRHSWTAFSEPRSAAPAL